MARHWKSTQRHIGMDYERLSFIHMAWMFLMYAKYRPAICQYNAHGMTCAAVERFRELGGEMVSFGSDSHDAGQVGFNFARMAEFVKSCGYRYGVHFEKRKPVMCRI